MRFLLAVFTATACLAHAEPAATSLRSYQQARRILDAALVAHGGLDRLRAIDAVRREISGHWWGSGQARSPYSKAEARGGEERVGYRLSDYANERWIEAVDASDPWDRVKRVNGATREAAFSRIVFGRERPYAQSSGREDARAQTLRHWRQHPEYLLRMAVERPETLRVEGGAVILADPLGAQLTLRFDRATHLLASVETLREHAIEGDAVVEIVFDDYRRVEGLQLPFRQRTFVAGEIYEQVIVRSTAVNPPVAEDEFAAPPDAVAMLDDPSEAAVEVLAPGLYLIRGPYNAMFAAFGDHAVMFEAPLSSAYAEKCLALVRAMLPGLPVRHVVATHFHYDHLGGLRPFIADGVTVLTTGDAMHVIQRMAAAPRTLRPDRQSRVRRPVRIESVGKERVLEDGLRRVAVYDVGPMPHAEHILVAYFVEEKVLFQADLFDPVSRELIIAGADAIALADRIAALGLDVERIVPVHGVPMSWAEFQRGVAIRARYQH